MDSEPPDLWPPRPRLADLLGRYDGFLLDAYGVLVDKERALPGAADFLARLDAAGRPWLVVSNAASRLPETLSAEFAALGVRVPPDRLLTSGGLLVDYFQTQGLTGARCAVLGPPESHRYVERAGGVVLPLADATDFDALIVADQKDVHFPDDLNRLVSALLGQLDASRPAPALLLLNPDLIYPAGPERYGITAGAIAALLEAVLAERYPGRAPTFLRLGKPNRPLFDAGRARLLGRPGSGRVLMIGDQLGTDIRGAAAAGIDSLLVGTGLGAGGDPARWPVRPDWYLPTLAHCLGREHPVGACSPAQANEEDRKGTQR